MQAYSRIDSMIAIDGSIGEGGGQVLRTALALSIATGRPFRIEHIRRKRPKPGLLRQHLTAVQAATAVGDAQVEGDTIGSTALTFVPRAIRSGEYRFAVGTAGSATLVMQTVLPPLLPVARDCMSPSYPEVATDFDRISQYAYGEEEAFLSTLRQGTAILDTALRETRAAGGTRPWTAL